MAFNTIFCLMLAVLLGLIFFSRFYRKKELGQLSLETKYIEALLGYKNCPNETASELIQKLGIDYGRQLGLSPQEIQEMIANDFSKVKL